MKKTFSRAFSLLLVLALLVSVIPSALAATHAGALSITSNGGNVVTVGDSGITLTAALSSSAPEGASLEGASWSWSSGENAVTISGGNTASATISAKDSVESDTEVTITATATVAATEQGAESEIYTGTFSVTVKPAATAESTLVITQGSAATVAYGASSTLTATYTPAGGQATTDGITWSVADNNYFSISPAGVITTKMAGGSAEVTASAGSGATAAQAKITVTVEKASVTASLKDIPTTLQPKGTKDANFTISPLTETDVTAVWSSNDTSKLTIDSSSGLITAVATGTTQVKLTLTLSNDKFTNYQFTGTGVADDGKSITLTSGDISVSEGSITMNTTTANLKSGSGSTAFTVTSVQLPENISSSDIKYDWSKETKGGANVSVSVDSSTGKVTVTNPTGEGSVSITLKALHKESNAVIAQTTLTIGVYQEHEIYATLKNNVSTFKFDEAVFSYIKLDTRVLTTSDTMQSALTGNTAYGTIKFECNNNILKLDTTTTPKSFLDNVKATVQTGKSGTQTIGYTWYGDDNVVVAEGLIYITVGETTGDIVYNTSYTEKVIFDDSDFTKFWNSKVSQGVVKGTFGYVTFEDMVTGVNPRYGQLYRDTSCSNKVTRDQMFTTSSKNGYYLLDNVTYKPDSSITTPVTVQIPFTIYNNSTTISSRDSVSGVIVININQATTTITSYGVGFGNGTKSIADVITETFKANTGDTISYVTFPAISTSTGKLFYDFSGVLKSREVLSSYKFYVNGKTTDLDLDDVVFVPRAGLYGEVTLYYKAYNAGATKEYSGTIVLNVQQKTKSAEFSDVGTSYSWAADSVDFLNYEGVAEGSGGKYRPASNITRGDFMLMLYRAFLEDEHKNDSITSNFSDVTKGSTTYSKETYQAVGVAKKLGIAQGTNGKFNPKSYITRQEAMTLIYRTLDEVNYDLDYTVSTSTSSFKDYSSVASYAKTAISDLIGHGIVIGNNSKINPTSNITRAEMAVILHRVLTY